MTKIDFQDAIEFLFSLATEPDERVCVNSNRDDPSRFGLYVDEIAEKGGRAKTIGRLDLHNGHLMIMNDYIPMRPRKENLI